MEQQQAIAVLKQGLAALFPYADPQDDPNHERARDQRLMGKALESLAKASGSNDRCDVTSEAQGNGLHVSSPRHGRS
jgi:hypothetical protein